MREGQGRRYEVLGELGRGGFGTVYRARLQGAAGFSKTVALKVLNADADLPAQMLVRLRDEARLLGVLRHRAIVGVDDLVELEQGWAVVMEYVPGADLGVVLRAHPVPLRVALAVVDEVGDALDCALSTPAPGGRPLDLVHRDVKPANIRLTPAGEVKLLDFGVARGELSTREAHTRSVAFGSLPYMAPERLLGHDTAAGDVYALGLVLVEALTRVRAHESAPRKPQWHDSFRVEASAMVDAALHAEGIDHSIRAAVVSLCERMLAFAPEDRPTAREAAREARRLAGRVDWPDPREWCAEHVPYAPLATVGEVTTILRERGAVEAPEDPAPPSTPMKRPAMSGAHLLAGVGMVGVLALGALLVLGGVGVWWSFRDPGPPASDARPHDPLTLPPGDGPFG